MQLEVILPLVAYLVVVFGVSILRYAQAYRWHLFKRIFSWQPFDGRDRARDDAYRHLY